MSVSCCIDAYSSRVVRATSGRVPIACVVLHPRGNMKSAADQLACRALLATSLPNRAPQRAVAGSECVPQSRCEVGIQIRRSFLPSPLRSGVGAPPQAVLPVAPEFVYVQVPIFTPIRSTVNITGCFSIHPYHIRISSHSPMHGFTQRSDRHWSLRAAGMWKKEKVELMLQTHSPLVLAHGRIRLSPSGVWACAFNTTPYIYYEAEH